MKAIKPGKGANKQALAPDVRYTKAQDLERQRLFQAVYDAPRDDEPRMVLADWLQQRGDPRGDFIALQMQPKLGRDATNRAKALLAQFGVAWLEDVAGVVSPSSYSFRRGFLNHAAISYATTKQRLALQDSPLWSTLESYSHGRHQPQRLRPGMQGLLQTRELEHDEELEALLSREQPWGIQELWLQGVSSERIEQLGQSELLPDLRRVGFGWRHRVDCVTLMKWPLFRRVRDLSIHASNSDDVTAIIADCWPLTQLERLRIQLGIVTLHLQRSEHGELSEVYLEPNTDGPWSLGWLGGSLLSELPKALFTTLRIGRHAVPKKQFRPELDAFVRTLPRLTRLVLDGAESLTLTPPKPEARYPGPKPVRRRANPGVVTSQSLCLRRSLHGRMEYQHPQVWPENLEAARQRYRNEGWQEYVPEPTT